MKIVQLFFVLAFVAAASCVPVDKKPAGPDTEVVIIPLEGQQGAFDLEDGIVDTGYPGGLFFNPFGNPFSGFMTGMDEMMRRLHEQMSQVLHRLPAENSGWTDLSDGKGNTTSTTKVINGHKVTVNETVYGDGDENSGAFFKIRVVDVRPTSEEGSNSDSSEENDNKSKEGTNNSKDVEDTTPKRVSNENSSPELVEESANEIPRNKPENDNRLEELNIETFGEDLASAELSDSQNDKYIQEIYPFSAENDIENAHPVNEVESNSVDIKPIDLSNDIYVNQMMADSGAPVNPYAEVFDTYKAPYIPQPYPYPYFMESPTSYYTEKRK